MLGCINEICPIVVDFSLCAFNQRNKKANQYTSYSRGDSVTWRPAVGTPNTFQYKRPTRKPRRFQLGITASENNLKPCDICKKTNHGTNECFFRKQNFNGRCHLCGEIGHKKADHFQ